jgi:nucleoside-diphosphate-sugar epimerase
MKPNGIAAPSRMKGDCRLFPFATLTSLVHTEMLEVNTRRRFPGFIEKAIRNEPITIFADGRQTRDFIYVKDVVAANAFFALKSQVTGVFNIACGRQITITDLALTIRNLARSSSTIRYGAERLGDAQYSVAGVDKTQTAGAKPVSALAGGLRATIEFFRKSIPRIEQGPHL